MLPDAPALPEPISLDVPAMKVLTFTSCKLCACKSFVRPQREIPEAPAKVALLKLPQTKASAPVVSAVVLTAIF